MGVKELGILFVIGAAGALIGDAGAVSAGVTTWIDHTGPFIWESPIWFLALVGLGTVSLGIIRLQLGPTRPGFDLRIGIAAWTSVVAVYSVTSLVGDDGAAAVTLSVALGVLAACVFADRPGVICALIAAVAGPATEILIGELDLSNYNDLDDSLFGVGLWLPGLYITFGVAVARITELLVARRAG